MPPPSRTAIATAKAHSHSPVPVHPGSTSRIERLALELKDKQKTMRELKADCDDISARLLTMVRLEGEPDAKGKVRYETEQYKYQIILGTNVYIGEKELTVKLTSLGYTPKDIAKVLTCAKRTEYSYVGVYATAEAIAMARDERARDVAQQQRA